MKFAAYTDDSIWSIEATADEARTEGLATMEDLDISDEDIALMKVAPISDELAAAIETADQTGQDVMFDLVNGTLVIDNEVEAA